MNNNNIIVIYQSLPHIWSVKFEDDLVHDEL